MSEEQKNALTNDINRQNTEAKATVQTAPQFSIDNEGKIGSLSREEMEARARKEEEGELPPKNLIEAALFMSSKALSIEDFSKLTGVQAPGYIKQLVTTLMGEYDARNSPIVIAEEDGKYIMRLRAPYIRRVGDFAQEAELSKGALRLLAYISQNEGISQSQVVKTLGTIVYQYKKELLDNGFITAEKKGRTQLLRTTKKFRDYFGI
ncbi:MAG: SMC-Scp complex subunit ScpB [Candidatus Micrarchaeia archaeon]